jgi:hypothetical protein
MKMMRRNKILLLLLIALFLSLTACDDADAELAIDLAIEWAFEKGLVVCANPSDDPATCVIETTPAFNSYVGGEVVEGFVSEISSSFPILDGLDELAGEAVKSNDLDEGARDVLDTGVTAKDIIEADSLAEEGFEEEDPEKIQQAIKIRENDWSYDEKLGVIYLAQGNQDAASDAQNQADEKAQQHLAGTLQQEGLSPEDENAYKACYKTYLTQYSHRENALVIQINKMMDANPPQDADLLIRHLDLVRNQLANLEQNAPGNPCFNYGPGE